jgi:hypothetical protein
LNTPEAPKRFRGVYLYEVGETLFLDLSAPL